MHNHAACRSSFNHIGLLALRPRRDQDLAFHAQKVKVNTTFLVGDRYGRLSTPCLRT